MGNKRKIRLVITALFTVIGLGMFAAAMSACSGDFTKLNTLEYETNTHRVQKAFHSIAIDTDTADIVFAASNNEECSIVCYEADNKPHAVGVQDDTLTVRAVDERKWYDYIGIFSKTPKITIYLPDTAYSDLTIKEHTGAVEIPKDFHFESIDISTSTGSVTFLASLSKTARIKTTTGSIYIEDLSAETLDLSVTTGNISVSSVSCTGDICLRVSTGKTQLTDIRCRNLDAEGDTGRIALKNVIAEEAFRITTDTGDVTLDSCDALKIDIETDTGDVTGSLRSAKIFTASADTGSINVPDTHTGGICRISTDTGDIAITLDGSSS